jgi:hypothetical protein
MHRCWEKARVRAVPTISFTLEPVGAALRSPRKDDGKRVRDFARLAGQSLINSGK